MAVPVNQFPLLPSDVVKWEAEHRYSRESVVLLTGAKYVTGQVLGRITASGKMTALNPAAADGSQNAAGICLFPRDATSSDQPGVALVNGPAIVATTALVWPAGISGANQTAALAALRTLLIKPYATA